MPSWHLADAAELAVRPSCTFHQSPPEAIAQVRPGTAYALDHNTPQFMAVDE